ncbi:MAG: alpha-amylase [Spirochaetes bacterium]|nr:alpha-amylase [Spirochaetota bacterium]
MRKVFLSFFVATLSIMIMIGCSNNNLVSTYGSDTYVENHSNDVDITESIVSSTDRLSVYDGYGSNVMLQGFGWNSASSTTAWYQVISNNSAKIKANFQWVWFPPPSDAGSNEGYLPRQLSNLNSKYGTETQLKAAITAISPAKAIADIVINHRVGTSNWADFTNPAWGTNSICSNDEYFASGNPGYGSTSKGAADTGSTYSAARDIDHTNTTVRTSIKDWMNNKLKSVGFVGWRYDYVKGYGGWYVGDYNSATSPQLSVGEMWEDGCPQSGLDNWVTATNHDNGKSLVFDFSTKNALNSAFGWFKDAYENGQTLKEYTYYNNYPNLTALKSSYGTPAGYIGWMPENCVTFVDNHDTGSTQQHWELRNDKVELAYVYTLTHPGLPCVAWDHFFDWGSTFQQTLIDLINIRKNNGITMKSNVNIVKAVYNEYAAVIDDKIAVKIGPGTTYSPGTGWTVVKSGTDYCIWKKSASTTTTTVAGWIRTVVFMYKQTVSGQDIFIKGGHDEGLVPTYYPTMDEPITYRNIFNATTASIKAADSALDWTTESALDWTCPVGTSGQPMYATAGYGQDPENSWGMHYWKFDVNMKGAKGDWFEFKGFMRQNGVSTWENNLTQTGTPYATINHWGRKGYRTKVNFNDSWVEIVALP